jgi:hypothetical protein
MSFATKDVPSEWLFLVCEALTERLPNVLIWLIADYGPRKICMQPLVSRLDCGYPDDLIVDDAIHFDWKKLEPSGEFWNIAWFGLLGKYPISHLSSGWRVEFSRYCRHIEIGVARNPMDEFDSGWARPRSDVAEPCASYLKYRNSGDSASWYDCTSGGTELFIGAETSTFAMATVQFLICSSDEGTKVDASFPNTCISPLTMKQSYRNDQLTDSINKGECFPYISFGKGTGRCDVRITQLF